MRCAFCHEQLSPAEARGCSDCGTQMHPACSADLARCPTLGCENPSFGTAPAREAGEPGGFRQGAWVLFGLLGPAIAFLVDAFYIHIDPLVWGRSYFLPEPETAFALTARQGIVWLTVLGSMTGLVLFLLGRVRASLPWLALGVVVAAAHAIVFVPLLPLSLFGIVFLGLGLLGFCPYFTLAVYLDVYRQARRRLARDDKELESVWLRPRWRWGRRAVLAGAPLAVVALNWLNPPPLNLPAPAARHLAGLDLDRVRRGARELVADGGARDERGRPARVPHALDALAKGAEVTVGEGYVCFDWEGAACKSTAYPYGYSLYVLTDGQELPPAPGTCYRSVELAPGLWSQYLIKGEPPGGGPAFQRLE